MADESIGFFESFAADPAAAENYRADRYQYLPSGPGLTSNFEVQEGVPVDGSNKLARKLSPFTLRLILPDALMGALDLSAVDINLMGRVGQESKERDGQMKTIRDAMGIPTAGIGSNSQQVLTNLRSTVSAGQYLQSTLGTDVRSVLTDLTTVADIRYQVEAMLQTPPLTLLINPESMAIAYVSTQQYSNRSRSGFIFERWGEAQPSISFSGSTGAWAAGQNPARSFGVSQTETVSPTGVQFATKRDSAAFQNFISLYQFYRNNGYIYDTVTGTEAHLYIGAIAIDYDQWTYVGHIDSFEYSYDDQNPHNIKWSMNFTVGQMIDHAESPIMVLPESSPTPAPGSLSLSEMGKLIGNTPQQGDLEGRAGGWLEMSGREGLAGRGATAIEESYAEQIEQAKALAQEIVGTLGEQYAQSPLQNLGQGFNGSPQNLTPANLTPGGE
jgi:hypothetical protein